MILVIPKMPEILSEMLYVMIETIYSVSSKVLKVIDDIPCYSLLLKRFWFRQG